MSETRRNIAVGLTTLAGLAGLLLMMAMFGRLPGMTAEGYRVKVALSSAAGLHADSKVRYAGIRVGRVETVQFRTDEPGVMVTARVQSDVPLPAGVRAQVYQPMLGGSPSLELYAAQGVAEGRHLSKTKPAVIQGEVGGMGQQIAQSLRSSLDRPMQQLDTLATSVKQLSSEWTKVGNRLNQMMAPRRPDAVNNGQARPNLYSVIRRTDQRMQQLGQTLTSVQKIVGDEQTVADLRASLQNAREASAKLSRQVDQLGDRVNKVSDKVSNSADALTKRYLALADDLAGTVQSVRALVNQASQGEGTIAQLLNDPKLYRNLNDAAQRIKATIDETKLLIEKWKAEGVPIQF